MWPMTHVTPTRATPDEVAASVADATVPRRFVELAEAHPDQVVLNAKRADGGWDRYTLTDLATRAGQIAAGLRAAGVQPGHRVASIDKNSMEFFEITFGLAKIGAVNVAVNWRLAPPEMRQPIAQIGAQAHARFHGRL